MATLARFKMDSVEALKHAASLGHRFTEDPRVAQMGPDRRLSWRCLDCAAMVVAYYHDTYSHGFVSRGSEGEAMSTSCHNARNR